jgi:hypothetical protein
MPLILIIIGCVLIIFNIRFVKDNKTSIKKAPVVDDNSFTRVLQNEEIDITAVDVIVGELRVEFSETILELQKEIVRLNDRIDDLVEDNMAFKNSLILPINEIKNDKEDVNNDKEKENLNETSSRMNEIGELLSKGFSVEEISEKFQIGRGEILLIKRLYQK